MKKQSATLISKLLNKNSQPSAQKEAEIVMMDARDLVTNPKNENYSMGGIEELATMIQLTRNIEPVMVRELPDGRFMLTSGHRRRLAQLYRFEHGMVDVPMLPTIKREIVNSFHEVITDDEMETLNVVFPNKGQRRNLSPSEEAAEIELVRPILYKIYQHEKAAGNVEGKFRTFFAEVLQMSEATLHRKEAVGKVSEEIRAEVDAGSIKPTAAAELASMDKDEQNAVVQDIKDRGEEVTVEAVKQAKRKIREPQEETGEPSSAVDTSKPLEEPAVDALSDKEPSKSGGQDVPPASPEDDNVKEEANRWVLNKIHSQLWEARHQLEQAEVNRSMKEIAQWQARVQRFRDIMKFLDGRED